MPALRSKILTRFTLFIVLAIIFCTTLVVWQVTSQAYSDADADPEPDEQQIVAASPLAFEESAMVSKAKSDRLKAETALNEKYNQLEKNINDYLQKQTGTYGYYLYIVEDLYGEKVVKTIGYNQDETFNMASTFKVPVNLYLYKQIADNKISLNTKLLYTKGDFETGTGSLQNKSPGGKYTVRELASRSIRESDNVAVNILVRTLDRDNISEFMADIGGHTIVPHVTPSGTPKDLATYMKAVYEFSQEKPELGNLLITDLKNTIFNDRIRAGTPESVPVAHKIGNLGTSMNDVGIVYANKPYILALMSKNINASTATAVEAQVAKMVYESIGH